MVHVQTLSIYRYFQTISTPDNFPVLLVNLGYVSQGLSIEIYDHLCPPGLKLATIKRIDLREKEEF